MAHADHQTTVCYCLTDWKDEQMAYGAAPNATRYLHLDISILIQASNPTPIITSLNTFTHDVDHFVAALYNIDGQLTTLANNLQRLENAIDGGYNHFQEV